MTDNKIENLWRNLWNKYYHHRFKRLILYPFALYQAYTKERLPEDAQSIVYVTLLTLVPLLGVAFALLRGFGVKNVIEPWLKNILSPMGESGQQVTNQILSFVTQTKASSLGVIGVVFLFFSVMKLAQKIETTLNRIWQIEDNRNIKERITGYISFILLGPLLIGALMSSVVGVKNAAWLQPYLSNPIINLIFNLLTSALPLVLVFCALSAVYYSVPNRKIQWFAACSGAIFFLVLWHPISWVFSIFIAGSQSYSVIYSSFASVIILLFWLYFLWLIFLFGAKFASLVQLPYLLTPNDEHWHCDEQEQLAIAVLNQSIDAFKKNEDLPSLQYFYDHLPARPLKILFIVNALKSSDLLIETSDITPRYAPSKNIDTYTLNDLYQALALPDNRYDDFAPQIIAFKLKYREEILKIPLIATTHL